MQPQFYENQAQFAPHHGPKKGMFCPGRARHHRHHHGPRPHHAGAPQPVPLGAPLGAPPGAPFHGPKHHQQHHQHHHRMGMAPPAPAPMVHGPPMPMHGTKAHLPTSVKHMKANLKLEHLEMKLNFLRTRMAIIASRRRRLQPRGHKLHPHKQCRPGKAERLEQRLNKLQMKAGELMRKIAELHGSVLSDDPKDRKQGHRHYRHRFHGKHHSERPRCHRMDLSTVSDLPSGGGYVAFVDVRGILKLNRARGEQVNLSTIVDFWTKRTEGQNVQVKFVVPMRLVGDLGIGEMEESKVSESVRFMAKGEKMIGVLTTEVKAAITSGLDKCLIITSRPKIHRILLKTLGCPPDKLAVMHLARFHELVQCQSSPSTENDVAQPKQALAEPNGEIVQEDVQSSSESEDSTGDSSDSDSDEDEDDDDDDEFEAIHDDEAEENADHQFDLDHAFAMALALGYEEQSGEFYQGPPAK